MLALAALLPLALSAAATPIKRQNKYLGAIYSTTNDLKNNQVFASYINTDGTLTPASATSANGTGILSHFMGGPLAPHGATLFSGGSLQVYGNYLFVPNAGSDTISSFKINPYDPAQLTLLQTVPTGYNTPVSIAVHPSGEQVCALGGGDSNGIRCYTFTDGNLTIQYSNDRAIGQNLSTPLYGPTNGTLSQLSFSPDGTKLVMAAKGYASGPQGFYSIYNVTDYVLSNGTETPVPKPGGNPFSITWDYERANSIISADVSGGVDLTTVNEDGTANVTSIILNGTKADCWSVQSPRTGILYVIDTAQALFFGVKADFDALTATVLSSSSVATGSQLPTDAVFVTGPNDDYVYAVDDTNVAALKVASNYSLTANGGLSQLTSSVSGLANTSAVILEGLAAYVIPYVA